MAQKSKSRPTYEFSPDGKKLIITCDLDVTGEPTKNGSGNIILCSSGGFNHMDNPATGQEIGVNVNILKK